jgi:hypothetical protein
LCAAGFAPAAEGFLAYREKDTKIRLVVTYICTVKSRQQELSFFISIQVKGIETFEKRSHIS